MKIRLTCTSPHGHIHDRVNQTVGDEVGDDPSVKCTNAHDKATVSCDHNIKELEAYKELVGTIYQFVHEDNYSLTSAGTIVIEFDTETQSCEVIRVHPKSEHKIAKAKKR